MLARSVKLPFGFGQATPLQAAGLAAMIALFALFPLMDRNQGHVSAVADAGYFLLLVFGLNIVVGFAGLLDLGYAAFFAIGAYTYAMVASTQFNVHINFWPMLILSACVAALFGLILGAPTLRLRGDYLAIVTLGPEMVAVRNLDHQFPQERFWTVRRTSASLCIFLGAGWQCIESGPSFVCTK